MHAPDLRAQLDAELADLETTNHTGAGCLTLRGSFGQLRAHLTSVDRLACELGLVRLESPSLTPASASTLAAIGEHLAKQLNYLEEPLRVVEFDSVALDVQLRSVSPRTKEDSKQYFEVHVDPASIQLCRYRKQPQEARERTTAVMTRETLSRICTDLISCLPHP